MASINGVSLKNVKTFKGHDGDGYYSGSVYLNSKKLGHWSQDSYCGPDITDFPVDKLQQIARHIAATNFVELKYKEIYNWSCLIDDVLELKLLEDYFKRIKKIDYNTVVTIKYPPKNIKINGCCKIPYKDRRLALKCFETNIKCICDKYNITPDMLVVDLYDSLEDFDLNI